MTQSAPTTSKFLSRATRGTVEVPPMIMIYGVPGVGKSTLGCSVERAAVLPVEDGTNQIDVHMRLPAPNDWTEVNGMVQELITEPHDCTALVIDTLDALEGMLFAHVCRIGKGETVAKAYGGFGNGFQAAVDRWREFLSLLADLRQRRNMTIVLLAHSMVRTFHNPDGPDYDRFIPKMNEKSWGVFFEKSDAVLFAQYELANTSTDIEEKGKAMTTGKRVLRTTQTGAWEAKNRFGFPDTLPLNIENGWSVIGDLLAATKKIRGEFEVLLAKADPVLAQTVRGWLAKVGNNGIELQAGLERLRARLAATSNASPAAAAA